MKKQSRFAIFLLIIGVAAIVVLVSGIFGLQKLIGLSREAEQQYQATTKECKEIEKVLAKKEEWENKLAEYDIVLASLDKDLTDYKYLPTYLEQLQRTTERTGNTLRSIRPRPIAKLDSNSPLIKVCYDRWLAEYPDIANAAKEKQQQDSTAAGQGEAANAAATESTAPVYKIQQFSLEVEGDYTSILRLLDALRSFPKLVYVHSISLSPPQRDMPNHLKANLETYAIITPDQYKREEKVDVVTEKVDKVAAVRIEGEQP